VAVSTFQISATGLGHTKPKSSASSVRHLSGSLDETDSTLATALRLAFRLDSLLAQLRGRRGEAVDADRLFGGSVTRTIV